MKRYAVILPVLSILVCGCLPAAAVPTAYTVTDLGQCNAYAINNDGQITGERPGATGTWRGFVWANGVSHDLPILNGSWGRGSSINSYGQVVGTSDVAGGYYHATTWINGNASDIGTLGGHRSFGSGVNDAGQIVGESETGAYDNNSQPIIHGFLWQSGQRYDLGTLLQGRNSRAQGINGHGTIVGYAEDRYQNNQTVIWKNREISNLNIMGGRRSMGHAINDLDQVVGSYESANGSQRAFLWDNGQVTDLGTLQPSYSSSSATAINNHGQIVGYSVYGSQYHAYIWEDGVMYDLNRLLATPTSFAVTWANGINDYGAIAAIGYYNGVYHGLLLEPVPEPSSILALVCGLGGIGGTIWRRRR